MPSRKRTQKNTITGMIESVQFDMSRLAPPIPLNEQESSYYNAIVKDRELSTWTTQHLLFAANLAKTYVQLDFANHQLETEGMSVLSEKGWPTPSPYIAIKCQLTNSIIAQMKTLGVSASQKGLSDAPQRARNAADARAREVIEKASADDLLA